MQHLISEDWNPQVFFVWFSADLSGEEEEAQQVTVKFAQQETERKRRARERSFGYLSQKSAEEPWFQTQFHNSHSEKAEVCSQSVAQELELTY
jgi:DNA-directed RNA polymerase-3 subunit RPC5